MNHPAKPPVVNFVHDLTATPEKREGKMSKPFQPITTQEELDRIIKARLQQQNRSLGERAEIAEADAAAWRREARRWEDRALKNLSAIKAHEDTINKFLAKLGSVLAEPMEELRKEDSND